ICRIAAETKGEQLAPCSMRRRKRLSSVLASKRSWRWRVSRAVVRIIRHLLRRPRFVQYGLRSRRQVAQYGHSTFPMQRLHVLSPGRSFPPSFLFRCRWRFPPPGPDRRGDDGDSQAQTRQASLAPPRLRRWENGEVTERLAGSTPISVGLLSF